MEAHADVLRETEKCFIVRIHETGEEANWPKSKAEQMNTDTFLLSGFLASMHAKHLRNHDIEVPV